MRPALLLVCALASCAGTPPDKDAILDPDEVVGSPAGWLDHRPVTYDEVGQYMRTQDPQAFARGLDGVLLERITRDNARANKVTVPPATLARATTARVQDWRRRLIRSAQAEKRQVDPDIWLRQVAGLEPAEFRAFMRRHAEVELLQNRLLRYEEITQPTVSVSIMVVQEKDAADGVVQRLGQGAPFAKEAKASSVHATAPEGGRIEFPLLREDFNDDQVRMALFAAKAGAVLGPYPVAGGGKTFYHVYRLDSRRGGRVVPYKEVEEEIARGLEARPAAVAEYERWRRRVLMRHRFKAAPPPTAPPK